MEVHDLVAATQPGETAFHERVHQRPVVAGPQVFDGEQHHGPRVRELREQLLRQGAGMITAGFLAAVGHTGLPILANRSRKRSASSVAVPTVERAVRMGFFCSMAIAGRMLSRRSTSGRFTLSKTCAHGSRGTRHNATVLRRTGCRRPGTICQNPERPVMAVTLLCLRNAERDVLEVVLTCPFDDQFVGWSIRGYRVHAGALLSKKDRPS